MNVDIIVLMVDKIAMHGGRHFLRKLEQQELKKCYMLFLRDIPPGLASKGVNVGKALRPVLTLYAYIFRIGFLNGMHGFVPNLFHSCHVFAKYAKA
jgi:hypothetical protein